MVGITRSKVISLKHQHGQGMGVSWTTNMNWRMNIVVGEPPVGKYSDCWDGVWQYEQWHTTSSCVLSAKKTQSEFMIIAVRFYCSILGVEMHTQRIGSVGNLWMFGAHKGANSIFEGRDWKWRLFRKKCWVPSLIFRFFHWSTVTTVVSYDVQSISTPTSSICWWWYEAVKPTDFGEKALEKCPLGTAQRAEKGMWKEVREVRKDAKMWYETFQACRYLQISQVYMV